MKHFDRCTNGINYFNVTVWNKCWKKDFIGTFLIPCRYKIKMCQASKSNRNANKMHFIVNIQREKESRIGRHALTSKPRLTPRLGLYVKACRPRLISSDLELEVILVSHMHAQKFSAYADVRSVRSEHAMHALCERSARPRHGRRTLTEHPRCGHKMCPFHDDPSACW